ARQEVSSALDEASSRPVKAISAIVEASAGLFLALMPLHPMLAADDFPALRASLEGTLGEIREKLVRRADLPAVAAALASGACCPLGLTAARYPSRRQRPPGLGRSGARALTSRE